MITNKNYFLFRSESILVSATLLLVNDIFYVISNVYKYVFYLSCMIIILQALVTNQNKNYDILSMIIWLQHMS